MNKLFLSIICLSLGSTSFAEVCGHVSKGSKNAQLIPVEGKTKSQLVKDEVLSCGGMLITHGESVWVELADQTQFKIAPNSFFEFSKKDKNRHQLYRGEVMVSAPPSIREFELTTPNSISQFSGGVMLIRYVPKAKETTLASFNRKVTFQNKFHSQAKQVVSSGEMSRLWIGGSRITPSQPEVMNPHSVKKAFGGFGLSDEEITEMTAVVTRTAESRSKALVADLESWEDLEKESADRSIASAPAKGTKVESSIDQKEADYSLTLMKDHLYGDDSDQKMFDESRKPASVRSEKLNDKWQLII